MGEFAPAPYPPPAFTGCLRTPREAGTGPVSGHFLPGCRPSGVSEQPATLYSVTRLIDVVRLRLGRPLDVSPSKGFASSGSLLKGGPVALC